MKRISRLPVLLGLLLVSVISATAGTVVVAGSDYLATVSGTSFGGVAFNGSPVGPGNTDTIVRRLRNADLTLGPATIPIEMVALQLVSAVPADFGLGTGFYYITLQSGNATIGEMTINLDFPDDNLPNTGEGTFTSFFDVFFDVRLGAPNGPIALSDHLVLSNQGAIWDADPSLGQLLVPGLVGNLSANLHVDKIQNVDTHQMDFFPFGTFTETHPTGAVHTVTGATIPEPASLLLVAAGGALLLLRRRRRGSLV